MHTLDHDKYKPLQKPVPGIRKTIFTQFLNGGACVYTFFANGYAGYMKS